MIGLIVGDPFSGLNVRRDSSLEISRTLAKRGWQVCWTTPQELTVVNNIPKAMVKELVVKSDSSVLEKDSSRSVRILKTFDAIFVRKDPPVDSDYVQMLWVLQLIERHTRVVNRPSSLLQYHEKLIPLLLVGEGILSEDDILPITLVQNRDQFLQVKSHFAAKETLAKPFLGFGGRGVEVLDSDSPENFFSETSRDWQIIQSVVPEVRTEGTYRAFVVNGMACEGFALQIKSSTSIVTNMASGGVPTRRPFQPREHDITQRIASWLTDRGILLAGLDFLGGRLNEVNITSPTGFAAFRQLGGDNYLEHLPL